MTLTDDDASSDDNETKDNAYRHGDDEIKVISLMMLCTRREKGTE